MRRHLRREAGRLSGVVVTFALGMTVAACGSGSPTPSSSPRRISVTTFAAAGPYAAGTVRMTMGDGDPVQVWYPVAKASVRHRRRYTYSLKKWVPASIADNPLLADLPDTVPTDSYLGAPVDRRPTAAGGPAQGYPVVLFAHGYGSYPQQSTFLTDHLASWGFVVMAPLEVANDLASVLSGTTAPGAKTAGEALDEALHFARAQDSAPKSRFRGLLDLRRIGVVGHSLGGGAAITMADNPAISVYAALAPAGGIPPKTAKPGLVMYGSNDRVVPPSDVLKTYGTLPPPKRLIVIDTAGHNVFDDICTIHKGGQRLVTALEAATGTSGGLGTFALLGTDGCFPPDVTPTLAYPLIDQAVTAEMRDGLGIDPASAGFGPGLDSAFAGVEDHYSGQSKG